MPRSDAKFIWTDAAGTGRNRWALFRCRFSLPGRPASGQLCLFADTRYRLIVNGRAVCHGPARFFTARPEYDTVDLAPFLRQGENVLAAVVNSYGCVSFHNEASVGGLIAWGRAADDAGHCVELATDESWRAAVSPAHRPETPALSFALNPGEHFDARRLPDRWAEPGFDDAAWPRAVPHGRPGHWGELQPRSIPMLDERTVLPRNRLGTWAARANADENVYSLIVTSDGGETFRTQGRVAVLTHLHSPREQRVRLGAWWGRYWLNGCELSPEPRQDVPLRQDFPAELREGWNELFVYETSRHGWWDFYLAVPRSAGLALSAEREIASPHTFLVGGPWEHERADLADAMPLPLSDAAELPDALGPWRRWPRDASAGTPCRQRAWKTFEPIDAAPAAPAAGAPGLGLDARALREAVGDGTLAVLFDFGCEVLGRPTLEFTAAPGTVVDVTYTERLTDTGSADVHRRYFVDPAERCVARAGRQRWQTFHPRGFRYLEVLVTGDVERFELHRVALTRASYPVEDVGRFECSDPVLNDVWRLGRATLRACMEDAYLDCPGRERGLYAGDFLVQFFANLAAFGDTKLFPRCIELFLLAQGDNGLIPGGAHGLPPGRHPDYSAILLQAAWHYWARTGETALLREHRDRLAKLADGLHALQRGRDLLDGSDLDAYIDLSYMDRGGVNCALNGFQQRAFVAAGRIFELLGDGEQAGTWQRRAERLAQAVRQAFWDERRGAFTDRRRADVPDTEPSVPANALALLYDIASPEQAPRALAWLTDAMAHNFRTPEPRENRDCNVTSYFAFYALGALYRHGRDVEAERFIRTYWGRMLERGARTCWEYLVDLPSASRCHAWSASPTHYLSTRVLGVRLPEAGDLGRVEIRPHPGTLDWAEGTYPHPAGPIRVRWRRRAGRVHIDWDAPACVEVTAVEPGGS